MRAKFINEAIKHLKPKTEEEIIKSSTPEELIEMGIEDENFDMIITGLRNGASIVETIKLLSRAHSSRNMLSDQEFKRKIAGVFKALKNQRNKIRAELRGKLAFDRLNFAEHYGLGWLADEIADNEGHIMQQEYVAQELSKFQEKNPLYILDLIKKIFDPLNEKAIKVDYKVISEYKYQLKLTENVYLSDDDSDYDEVEITHPADKWRDAHNDRYNSKYDETQIEDEVPVEFTTTIILDIQVNKYDYTFSAKYKDGSDIGYDEGTYSINVKEMGKELTDHLQYFIGDVVEEEYGHFKSDILLLVQKMHTESEPFDEEKYYPQLYAESAVSKKINKINTV